MEIVVELVGSDPVVIDCGDGKQSIQWLREEIARRLRVSKLRPHVVGNEIELKIVSTGSLLNSFSLVCNVLKDEDVVCLVDSTQGGSDASPASSGNETTTVNRKVVQLDGNTLLPITLVELGKGNCQIEVTKDAWFKIRESRKVLDEFVKEERVVYGVTTGFGKFAREVIPIDSLKELQLNLLRSHACGVGKQLTLERARMMLALRINVLAKGFSGISVDTLEKIVAIFNANLVPWVPEQGTVGASGDLCPLAHIAITLLGEGKMWSPKTGWAAADKVLFANGLKPINPQAKEGLALINGTQLITALGAEALERATAIARQADVVAALTLEVLKGSTKAYNKEIHNARPHKGQGIVAERLRSLLHSNVYQSEVSESHRLCNRVQDAYTLRCCPQVHGITHDTIEFVRGIITTEMNSATDNPMVFAAAGETMSGGNFHGEYPAKALDYLAIAIHEIASMSERRVERLVNPAYSELPAFLVNQGGLNSGFMMAHVTSASLVSENKVLCHPSSVDSLTTSAGTEDHVSMGGMSARKALQVVENVENAVAIELLAACQGFEFLRPQKSTEPLEAVYSLVRSVVRPWDKDRYMAPDIAAAAELLRTEKVWKTVEPFIERYHKEVATAEKFEALASPTSSRRFIL